MRNRFVWKGMTQAVRQWVSACHKCLLRKRQVPLQTKYNIQPEAEAPVKRICIDIVGPLVKTRNGNTHIFTIYDPFSHWPSAYPISQTDSATIVQCLRKHIANHSVPSATEELTSCLMKSKVVSGESWSKKIRNDTVQAIFEWKRGKISPLSDFCDQPLHRRHGRQRH